MLSLDLQSTERVVSEMHLPIQLTFEAKTVDLHISFLSGNRFGSLGATDPHFL